MAEFARMKNDPESKPTDKLKRNHHGRRVEELERLRVKRREKRLKADPPLAAPRPDLFEIRDSLVAARSSLQAALRTGWLVHLLARTIRKDFDVYSEFRIPSVRDNLTDCVFDEEMDEIEDLDLRPRYKTLMRYKRLWESFADAADLDPDQFPDALFDAGADTLPGNFAAARALIERHGATAASLARKLRDGQSNVRLLLGRTK